MRIYLQYNDDYQYDLLHLSILDAAAHVSQNPVSQCVQIQTNKNNVGIAIINHPSNHHFYGWFKNHQKWVVLYIVIITHRRTVIYHEFYLYGSYYIIPLRQR